MPVINSRDTWRLVTQESRMKKGPLVRVKLQEGRYAKMYRQDAIEQGLLEPDEDEKKEQSAPQKKSRPAQGDKMRQPQKDKGAAEQSVEDAAPPEPDDDFTTIDGVGPATARALAANGVETFEALREAGELDYLSATVNAAIEEWRNSG